MVNMGTIADGPDDIPGAEAFFLENYNLRMKIVKGKRCNRFYVHTGDLEASETPLDKMIENFLYENQLYTLKK